MSVTKLNEWIICPAAHTHAELRLFCLPFAGGSISTYYTWPKQLPPEIEVCLIQLPGRGERLNDPPFHTLTPLITSLANAILPYLDKPFVLLGHSMGAVLAFELVRELRNRNAPEPMHIFFSGRRPVHLPEPHPPIRGFADRAFLQALYERYGTTKLLLEDETLMKIALPVLRADLALCETYQYVPTAPFTCSITAYGGISDRDVSAKELTGWRQYTRNTFHQRMFPGGHFFIESEQKLILQALQKDLAKVMRNSVCQSGKKTANC